MDAWSALGDRGRARRREGQHPRRHRAGTGDPTSPQGAMTGWQLRSFLSESAGGRGGGRPFAVPETGFLQCSLFLEALSPLCSL